MPIEYLAGSAAILVAAGALFFWIARAGKRESIQRAADRKAAAEAQAASSVQVRSYSSIAAFQADAVAMSAAGWTPTSQVETTGGFPAAAGLLALIGVFVALFVHLYAGAAIVVIAVLIGMASRRRGLVVTYRPDTTKAPAAEATGA